MEAKGGSVTLIIIDSSRCFIKLAAAYFEMQPSVELVGYADNALEGLRLIKEKQPNVVMLDMVLPGESGYYVLEQLQGMASESRPAVIMLSSLQLPDGYAKAMELGASYYYLKPVDFYILTQRIISCRKWLPIGNVEHEDNIPRRLNALMRQLSVSTLNKDYGYVSAAMHLIIEDNSLLESMPRLYSRLGGQLNTSDSAVENAVSCVAALAWLREREDGPLHLFASRQGKKADSIPDNAAFLWYISSLLQENKKIKNTQQEVQK